MGRFPVPLKSGGWDFNLRFFNMKRYLVIRERRAVAFACRLKGRIKTEVIYAVDPDQRWVGL